MSLASSQCSIASKHESEGPRDFVFVKRDKTALGLGLWRIPENDHGEPRIAWTNMELPTTLRNEMAAKVELVKKLPSEPQEQLDYLLALGGDVGYHELCYGVVYTEASVIWASSSGILALSRENGTTLQYWESFVAPHRLWMDEAKCTIKLADETYELTTKRGGSFVADCHRTAEQTVVYFNGIELIVLRASNETGIPVLAHRIPYDADQHWSPNTKPGVVQAQITGPDLIVTLDGRVFL